jgi:hypothetical protein
VPSHTLFWPSGRKLFRQRSRMRWAMAAGCFVVLAVAAGSLLKLA